MHTMDHAIAWLGTVKHWTLKCNNCRGRRRHECTVWNGGRRVTVSRLTPLAAVQGAMEALRIKRGDDLPRLKLVK